MGPRIRPAAGMPAAISLFSPCSGPPSWAGVGGGFSQSPGEGKPSSRNPELALDGSAMAVRPQAGGVCPGWGGEQWRESGGPDTGPAGLTRGDWCSGLCPWRVIGPRAPPMLSPEHRPRGSA